MPYEIYKPNIYNHTNGVGGAVWWRQGTVLTSQSKGCWVESQLCPGCHWMFPLSVPIIKGHGV